MTAGDLFLFRGNFNHVVNSQNGDGGFSSETELFKLAVQGFKDTCLHIIAAFSVLQVQAGPLQVLLLGVIRALRGGVEHSQLGDQVGGVLGSVGR